MVLVFIHFEHLQQKTQNISKKKKNQENLPSLHTQSTDNNAGVMTIINCLSIVRVELLFFRFSRIFLPPYLSPVHILMPQYIVLSSFTFISYSGCLNHMLHWLWIFFLFCEFYKLLQVFALPGLKNYLGLLTEPWNALYFWITVHLCYFSSDKDLQVLELFNWDKNFHFWMLLHTCSFQNLFLNNIKLRMTETNYISNIGLVLISSGTLSSYAYRVWYVKKKVRNKHCPVLSDKIKKEPWVNVTENYGMNVSDKYVTLFLWWMYKSPFMVANAFDI